MEKDKEPPRRWSKAETEFLKSNYAKHGGEYVATMLGRTTAAVHMKAVRIIQAQRRLRLKS